MPSFHRKRITRTLVSRLAPWFNLFCKSATAFCLSVASTDAFSQANAIAIGESDIIPSIQFEFSQDSNALRRDIDEIENNATVIKPELLWSADRGLTTLSLNYSGDFSSGDLEELNHDDHALTARIATSFNKRARFQARALVSLDHLDLGSDIFTRENPAGLEQVEFAQQVLDLQYTYGAAQAKGQFITRLILDNLDYTNNDALTRDASRFVVRPSIAFSYRLSGDTRAFVSAALQQVDRSANGADRTDLDLAVGGTWDITGRTGGSASLGFSQSSLDGGSEQTEGVAEIGFYYQPRLFSRFDLEFQRGFFNDGFGLATVVAVNDSLDVSWRYDWSSRVYHSATASFERVVRACPDVGDQTASLGLEVGIQVRRWVSLGFGIRGERRANDECSAIEAENAVPDYDRQEGFAFLKFVL